MAGQQTQPKRLIRTDGPLLIDADTGREIVEPWELNASRQVVYVGDKRELGPLRYTLTTAGFGTVDIESVEYR